MAGPGARRLFDAEMGVERHHLHLGQRIFVRIEKIETRLHEGRVRLGEERPHAAPQEIHRRYVVDIENGEIIVRRLLHGLMQGAALVAAAVGTLQRHDVEAPGAQFRRYRACQFGGLVGAVVEDLDMQLVARPVEGRRGLDATAHDGTFVEGRDLHDDMRQLGIRRQRRGQQRLLARQAGRPQPPIEHDHIKQAADEGRDQQAARTEDVAEDQGDAVERHRQLSRPSWACG